MLSKAYKDEKQNKYNLRRLKTKKILLQELQIKNKINYKD